AELRLPDGHCFDARADETLPERFRPIIELGTLASAPEPFDPMEIAFHDLGGRGVANVHGAHRTDGWRLRHRYPLDPALLAVSHLWETGGGDQMVAAKGAPEAIADLCRLDPAAGASMREAADAMAARGLRVLGVAEAAWRGIAPPPSARDFGFGFR